MNLRCKPRVLKLCDTNAPKKAEGLYTLYSPWDKELQLSALRENNSKPRSPKQLQVLGKFLTCLCLSCLALMVYVKTIHISAEVFLTTKAFVYKMHMVGYLLVSSYLYPSPRVLKLILMLMPLSTSGLYNTAVYSVMHNATTESPLHST